MYRLKACFFNTLLELLIFERKIANLLAPKMIMNLLIEAGMGRACENSMANYRVVIFETGSID